MHLNKITILLIVLLACTTGGCYRYSYGYTSPYPRGYRIQPYSSGGVVYGYPAYTVPAYRYPAQGYYNPPGYYGPTYYGPGPGYYGGGGYGYHHHHGWHHR